MLERAFQPSGPNSEHITHYRQKQRLRARQTIERDFNNWLPHQDAVCQGANRRA